MNKRDLEEVDDLVEEKCDEFKEKITKSVLVVGLIGCLIVSSYISFFTDQDADSKFCELEKAEELARGTDPENVECPRVVAFNILETAFITFVLAFMFVLLLIFLRW